MGFYDGGWWFEISQVVVFDLAADSLPSLCLESCSTCSCQGSGASHSHLSGACARPCPAGPSGLPVSPCALCSDSLGVPAVGSLLWAPRGSRVGCYTRRHREPSGGTILAPCGPGPACWLYQCVSLETVRAVVQGKGLVWWEEDSTWPTPPGS